jgi:sugar phosphate isomerase/epimerase
MGVNNSAPNLYQFSADRPRERELAERYTLRTIEMAAKLKAPVVVLHLGSIEIKNYTDKLLEMVGRNERETPKYKKLCAELDEKREGKKGPFIERVKQVLKKILPEAESRGIKLGVENRQALEELPFEGDFEFIFRELASPNLVYWHDTGHAQIKEHLGFLPQLMQLESLHQRLFGFHIHDVQFPGRDHCMPGSGTIDFTALKRLVKPDHVKVFEFGPSLTADEVARGVTLVKHLWGS